MNELRHFLETELFELLVKLNADTPAAWGLMNAQQMVEHLVMVQSISTGKFEAPITLPPDKVERRYQAMFVDKVPMPRGFRNALVPDTPTPLQFESIEAAIAVLRKQVMGFLAYFEANPEARLNHPVLGSLGFEEWLYFNNVHHKHHLVQFGLLPDPNPEQA